MVRRVCEQAALAGLTWPYLAAHARWSVQPLLAAMRVLRAEPLGRSHDNNISAHNGLLLALGNSPFAVSSGGPKLSRNPEQHNNAICLTYLPGLSSGPFALGY